MLRDTVQFIGANGGGALLSIIRLSMLVMVCIE